MHILLGIFIVCQKLLVIKKSFESDLVACAKTMSNFDNDFH